MKKLLLLALFPFIASAQSIGTAESGINWNSTNSTITISNFSPSHPDHLANFYCFGQTTFPVTQPLSFFVPASEAPEGDFMQRTITSNHSECFQQAGIYEITIQLEDNAGNSRQESFSLEIRPNTPTQSNSSITSHQFQKALDNTTLSAPSGTVDCSQENLVANNVDSCGIRATFRDHFDNIYELDGNEQIDIEISGKTPGITNLDITSFPIDNFFNGLNITPQNLDQSDANSNKNFDISLTALAPSLEIITSNLSSYFNLSRITSYPTTIRFLVPQVNTDGSLSTNKETINESINAQFIPWVRVRLSNQAPSGSNFNTPDTNIQMPDGEPVTFHAFADNIVNHLLPPQFNTKIRGFTSSNVDLYNQDIDNLPQGFDINSNGVTSDNHTENFVTTSNQHSYNPSEKVSISSTINLNINHNSTLYNISHPAGNLGTYIGTDPAFVGQSLTNIYGDPFTQISMVAIGADIEGKAYGPFNIKQQSNNLSVLTNLSGSDLREDIMRNVYKLIRGKAARTSTEFNIDTGFTNEDLVYFKNTNVRLTGTGSFPDAIRFDEGAKTLIIENGNLLIDRDILYPDNNTNHHFGIILINSNTTDRRTGNLFIHGEVQHMNATVYADGSLLSTLETDPTLLNVNEVITNRNQSNLDNPSAPLGKQLIFNGMLFTKNTIGGAADTPPQNPWQEDVTLTEAQKYDLNYLRRYGTPYSGGHPIPDNSNNHCAKISSICDANQHALVIRTNNLNDQIPLPVFNITTKTSLQ